MATDSASLTQSYLVLVRFRGISGWFGPAMGILGRLCLAKIPNSLDMLLKGTETLAELSLFSPTKTDSTAPLGLK